MTRWVTTPRLSAVLIGIVALAVPQTVAAQGGFDDRSDELPGFKTSTAIIIVAAAIAVVVGVSLLARAGGDEDEAEADENGKSDAPSDSAGAFQNNSIQAFNRRVSHRLGQPFAADEPLVPFDVLLGWRLDDQTGAHDHVFGVSLRF